MDDLQQENRVLTLRLSLAHAFIKMLRQAYDALRYHGVDYQTLPTFKNADALDEADKLPLEQGRRHMLGWLERVQHDITAAVRRKQMRRVE